MEQRESERWVLMLVEAGVAVALAEFLIVSLLIGGGTIGGFMNGLVAGGLTLVTVVVLVWLATVFLVPVGSAVIDRPVTMAPETKK